MNIRWLNRLAAVACAASWFGPALAADAVVADDTGPVAQPTVEAVWVEARVRFVYQPFTSGFSCSGLQTRVGAILAALGMRPGFQVRVTSCVQGQRGGGWMPTLEIVGETAQLATAERLAALAASQAGTGGDAPANRGAFAARARLVHLQDEPGGMLTPGDCELVDQFRKQVLPALGMEVVENRTDCPYRYLRPGIISLTVRVLEPVEEPTPPSDRPS